jgi:hypothetical protein
MIDDGFYAEPDGDYDYPPDMPLFGKKGGCSDGDQRFAWERATQIIAHVGRSGRDSAGQLLIARNIVPSSPVER